MCTSLASALLLALVLASGAFAQVDGAPDQPEGPGCHSISPIALPCVALQKVTEAVVAATPAVDAYRRTWEHRAAVFQSRLGDRVPLREAAFIGTHNSFNSVAEGLTVSHGDSNQRMTLTQQLDSDVRSLELDLHLVGGQVLVCHGRGREELHFGCTNEAGFADVLAPVAAWLKAHPDEVLELYLEDHIEDDAGYADVVKTLTSSLSIFRPDPSKATDKGCTPLPLDVSRRQIRSAGAQVFLVGNCAKGWGSVVHEWNSVHVESGSTAAYRPFPACDATYKRSVYTSKLVRYFEDSTLVAVTIDPTTPATNPDRLTPAKVRAMTDCGVTLVGLDQLLPDDGRIEATLWSWAKDEPRAGSGCARLDTKGRWVGAACTERHRAACARDGAWTLTPKTVTYAQAAKACRASRRTRPTFGLPLTGNSNAELAQLADGAPVWIHYRIGKATPAAP